ncbi:MAG: sulfite exporter TauE/SafE family protein [Acidobacteriota bacterium]
MLVSLLAFITGILVGLTGTGAGVILTPLLLLATPFHALTVIGTDLMSGAFTKLAGVFEHRKLGQVQWNLAGYLLAGSVPGSLAGILFVHFLKGWMSVAQLDHVLKVLLGLTLFGVSLFLPFLRGKKDLSSAGTSNLGFWNGGFKLAAVGGIVGFLVSMTSVGSGSLLMISLLVLVPLPLGSLVGTDILFGLVTTALAGSLHWEMGNFDSRLFLLLVAGEVPGVIIGSRLTRRIPERYITWVFSILYFSLGARLLVG